MTEDKKIRNMMWEATKAAVEAGKAIMKIYETDFSVSNKSDNSPLTMADTKANSIITIALEGTGIPILSEEGKQIPYTERKAWDQFWLVDPLDGTKEFVNRNGEFTVNIALIEKGYPLAAVIYIPVTDELFIGLPHEGALKLTLVSKLLEKAAVFEDILSSGIQL